MRNKTPSAKPMTGGITPAPEFLASSIEGISSPNTEAAIMIPAENPSESWVNSFLLALPSAKTKAAPMAVQRKVKPLDDMARVRVFIFSVCRPGSGCHAGVREKHDLR